MACGGRILPLSMHVLGLASVKFCNDIIRRVACCWLCYFKRMSAVEKQVRRIRCTAVLLCCCAASLLLHLNVLIYLEPGTCMIPGRCSVQFSVLLNDDFEAEGSEPRLPQSSSKLGCARTALGLGYLLYYSLYKVPLRNVPRGLNG